MRNHELFIAESSGQTLGVHFETKVQPSNLEGIIVGVSETQIDFQALLKGCTL